MHSALRERTPLTLVITAPSSSPSITSSTQGRGTRAHTQLLVPARAALADEHVPSRMQLSHSALGEHTPSPLPPTSHPQALRRRASSNDGRCTRMHLALVSLTIIAPLALPYGTHPLGTPSVLAPLRRATYIVHKTSETLLLLESGDLVPLELAGPPDYAHGAASARACRTEAPTCVHERLKTGAAQSARDD
ncbi:hypothetical protein B0H13DRAFT_60913 [Mycena leptocephala]|nr:hypothetical protein B0H13DRAFT_60913 [Mycena leptocephala]